MNTGCPPLRNCVLRVLRTTGKIAAGTMLSVFLPLEQRHDTASNPPNNGEYSSHAEHDYHECNLRLLKMDLSVQCESCWVCPAACSPELVPQDNLKRVRLRNLNERVRCLPVFRHLRRLYKILRLLLSSLSLLLIALALLLLTGYNNSPSD